MGEGATAEASLKNLEKAGEEGFKKVLEVFAEYIAPIVGLVLGWALGSQVGGVASVGNFIYGIAEPIAKGTDPTRIADIAAGTIIGGIFVGLGAGLWSAGGSAKKSIAECVKMGLLRFLAGVSFGIGANAFVAGLTGNVQEGWIDNLPDDIKTTAGVA